MILGDAAPDLTEHGVGAAAARGAAYEGDDAEVAREGAAVLHLHEGAHPVESRVRLDAGDRPHVAGDESRRILAALRNDGDVLRQSRERVGSEVRGAPGDVDAAMRTRRSRRCLARLRDRLVRHAARADHRDVGAFAALLVAVGEQPLAHLERVDVRDLAAQEPDGEGRHTAEC